MTDRVNRETGEPGWPDLYQLSRPFPKQYVERKDGQDFVAHHVIVQRLLSIVGPYDFELVQVIRGDLAARPPDPTAKSRRGKEGTPALQNVVVGGIWRLTCRIDGRQVRVEEVGDVGDVWNWAHDGARLKDAASDAIKRCCMRFGLGLSLWAQEHWFLDKLLAASTEKDQPPPEKPEPQSGVLSPEEAAHRGMQFQVRAQRSPAGLGGPADPAWAGKDGRQ